MNSPPICNVTPFTLQDFPDYSACILWFGGCNMRCTYCHNPDLVLRREEVLPWEKIREFLLERKKLLDGVVFSGGECTLFPDLQELIIKVKSMGYKIKLDSNGLKPDVLGSLLSRNLLDYLALDYKAPKSKFGQVTGSSRFSDFESSLKILCKSNLRFEIRTTVHTALLDEEDICRILSNLDNIGFEGNYFIQNYRSSPKMLKALPEQTRILNLHELPVPKNFKLLTRNF